MRTGVIQASAALAVTVLLTGCVSTVSFRASPANDGTSLLNCIESSSGVCKFDVTGVDDGRHVYKVAVGQSVAVSVPDSGLNVHGCVADKALPSCSTVHVAPTTRATSQSKGW